MFLDALSKFGTSTISIPISALQDNTGNLVSTIGVGVPASSVPHLTKVGFSHNLVENISKSIFESSGKTLTGHWMDATGAFKSIYPKGISVGWHRIQGHHFITDAIRAFKNPNLSVVDFYKHLATDVVTKNGLPLLPESVVRNIASVLGVTPTQIMPWVSMNILDIGASVLAVSHSVSNVTSIIYGNAEWGFGYALDTFGIGALEIVSGFSSSNPILIASGSVDIACGGVTAYDYYTQPFFCGVPVNDILTSSMVGISFATIIAGAELLFTKNSSAAKNKIPFLAERIGTAGLLSGLSVIAVPLSITTSFGIMGYKLAKTSSNDTNEYIKAIPITGKISEEIDEYIVMYHIGQERMQRMMKYLD